MTGLFKFDDSKIQRQTSAQLCHCSQSLTLSACIRKMSLIELNHNGRNKDVHLSTLPATVECPKKMKGNIIRKIT